MQRRIRVLGGRASEEAIDKHMACFGDFFSFILFDFVFPMGRGFVLHLGVPTSTARWIISLQLICVC